MVAMEAFLANNVKFQSFDDIIVFITNVSKDHEQALANEFNIFEYLDEDKVKTANDVLNYLTITQSKFMITNGQLGMLAHMISSMPKSLLQFLFYKRNFMSLVGNTKVLELMLNCVPNGEELFNDPNHPLDSIKQPLDVVYRIVRIIVGYEYAYFRRYDMAMTMERAGVALVDTDSNFLLLENLYNVICENANLDKEEKVNIVNVCNVVVYICSQYIQKVLDVFTGNMNIPEDKQPIINMKSELTCIIIIMELTIKSSN